MAAITVNLSPSVNETGNAEVLFRLSVTREKRFRIKTGFFVPVERWSEKKHDIIVPKLETRERLRLIKLQSEINELREFILNQVEVADVSNITRSWVDAVIDRFFNPEKYKSQVNNLFRVFKEYIKAQNFAPARKTSVEVTYRLLRRYEYYMQLTDKGFELEFVTFDKYFLREFENYIRDEYKYRKKLAPVIKQIDKARIPKQRSQNTINKHMKILRAFFKWCVENHHIEENPFNNYKIRENIYGTPYYISIDERNQIYSHDFSADPQLEIQRDIFIFQCLVGVRISDLYKLRKSNIVNNAVEYIAQKTIEENTNTIRVPLNAQAKEIIAKYKNHEGDELFPFIAKQNYNYAIKEIFTQVGITRYVTVLNPRTRQQEQVPLNEVASSHLARRTFIGNLYKQVKDPSLVGSLSGHKEGSKAFARYRDIDDEMKSDLVDLLL